MLRKILPVLLVGAWFALAVVGTARAETAYLLAPPWAPDDGMFATDAPLVAWQLLRVYHDPMTCQRDLDRFTRSVRLAAGLEADRHPGSLLDPALQREFGRLYSTQCVGKSDPRFERRWEDPLNAEPRLPDGRLYPYP